MGDASERPERVLGRGAEPRVASAVSWRHPTYEAATRDARSRATASGLSVYLRRGSTYEGGWITGYASRGDSEWVLAEVIHPGEPQSADRWPDDAGDNPWLDPARRR